MPARTNLELRSAKPRSKPYKLSDGGGLYLLVKPDGIKIFHLAYRFGGKQKLISFGAYPKTSLADARSARANAKDLLADGVDPSAHRKSEKAATKLAQLATFKSVADECLVRWKAQHEAPATIRKKEWLLEFALKKIGHRAIAAVTAQEVLEQVLKKIESNGRHETAIRVRSIVGQVFRYAVATGRASRDITVDLRGALITPKVRHHPAITDPAKIGELLRAIDGFEGQPTTQIALKLAPLLFLRPGELRKAEWSEVDFKDRFLRIGAAKMKERRDHITPLSKQALLLLTELREHTGGGKFLFPSVRSWQRPMSENTLNAALRRLGYSSDEATTHGYRTTASTRLNESGKFRPDVIERQLAHKEPNAVRRAYNAAEHLSERTAMMQDWADYLDELHGNRKIGT